MNYYNIVKRPLDDSEPILWVSLTLGYQVQKEKTE